MNLIRQSQKLSEANRSLARHSRQPTNNVEAEAHNRNVDNAEAANNRQRDQVNTDDEDAIQEKPKKKREIVKKEIKDVEEKDIDAEVIKKDMKEEKKKMKLRAQQEEEKRLLEELERLKLEEEQLAIAKKPKEQMEVEKIQEPPKLPASNARVPKRLNSQKIEAPIRLAPKTAKPVSTASTSQSEHQLDTDDAHEREAHAGQTVDHPKSPDNGFGTADGQGFSKLKKPTRLVQPQIKFSNSQTPVEQTIQAPAKAIHQQSKNAEESDSSISFDAGDSKPKQPKSIAKDDDWNVGGTSLAKKTDLPIRGFKSSLGVAKNQKKEDDDWDA